jgi:benzoate-CoA ligase family protein
MSNATTAFLDEHVESGRGDRVAIVTPTGEVTYRELLGLANRTGNLLRELGVAPEQRVGLLLPDGVDWAATFLGVLRIGAVAVPLNTRLAAAEWADMLGDSRAKVLVADAARATALLPHLDALPHLAAVVTSSSLAERRATASPALIPATMSGDDMAFWLYTSGTTGGPKAAIHLHRDLPVCRHYGRDVLGAGEDDRAFATSKLFFAYALGTALLIPLFVGGRTFLHPAWADPETVVDVLARFAPTLFFSVPTLYARLLRTELPRETFRSVRWAVSAGEALPAEIARAFPDRFGVEILDGLGATETIFMVLSNRPGRSRPGSCGLPVPGTEAKLCDEGGREVPDWTPGVLHVRTPSASPAYWNRVAQSRRTFVGEWFRTGDVCTRDADGFYYHRGRENDFFKVAGLWVAPAEVEALLCSHPSVLDAGVVGAEEASGLTKPFAFVVLDSAAAADAASVSGELAGLCAEKLPPHQRPKTIQAVSELPRTASGKLQRFRLRDLVPR